MSWRLRYHLDWDTLDAARITDAAHALVVELGGRLQVEPGDDSDGRTFEVFFTVPIERLSAREDDSFEQRRIRAELGHVSALTLTVVFWERPPELHKPGRARCAYSLSSEDGSNDLCKRTSRFTAEWLAQALDAWPAGEGHTKRRLATPE